jgi:hypothetical protein
VTFTAYQPDGTLLSGGTNPVTVTIPAGGQYARLVPEIFGVSTFNGWVQATSTATGLTGFFINGNNANTDLDGAGSVRPSADVTLPLMAEDAVTRTEVSVLNGNAESTSVTLTLYANDGSVISSKNATLPARGLMRQTLLSIFGAIDFSAASHLRVRGDRPVVTHEVVADIQIPGTALRRETGALSGQTATNSTRYVIPEFATGGGWQSLLGLINTSGVGQELTLTAYKEDGTPWSTASNPKRVSLPGNGGVRGTVADLFGFSPETLRAGWIEVRASVGFINAYIGYGNTLTPSFALVQAVPAEDATRFAVYSHVAEGVGYYTGLTVVNPGTDPVDLEFFTLRPDGTTVGRSTFTLGPNQHRAQLFREVLTASLRRALRFFEWIRSGQRPAAIVRRLSTPGADHEFDHRYCPIGWFRRSECAGFHQRTCQRDHFDGRCRPVYLFSASVRAIPRHCDQARRHCYSDRTRGECRQAES